MNMLEKLDAMEHNDMHSCDLTGCTCGLDEVCAAVRELVKAANDFLETADYNPLYAVQLNAALEAFV